MTFRSDLMKGKHIFLGFLTGAAIAGIGTLLYAPTSGKTLRHNLQINYDKLHEILADIKDKLNQVKTESASVATLGKESIPLFITEVTGVIKDWQTDVQPHKREIQKLMKDIETNLGELEKIVVDSVPVSNKD